jgi:uncharacterized repeat protein (TIGR03803 family)
VVRDSRGTLYGTTESGGNIGGSGAGIIFMVKSDGTESVLYNFSSYTNDGIYEPTGELLLDPKGNLYGATLAGGATCNCGSIYEIIP